MEPHTLVEAVSHQKSKARNHFTKFSASITERVFERVFMLIAILNTYLVLIVMFVAMLAVGAFSDWVNRPA